jgi:O-Antigen ligase
VTDPQTDTARTTLRSTFLAALLAGALLAAALRGGSYAPVERGELFVVILWVLALAIALGLIPRQRVPRGALVAVAALFVLAAWMAVGLVWTESDERTMIEVARTLGFAGLLMLVLWTYGRREWQIAAGLVTGVAVLICAMALVSRLAPDILTSALTSRGLHRRLAYPLNYWNGLGSWAAMAFALALAHSAHARSSWLRGAALAGVCLAAGATYLTYSRSAAIAVGVATVGVVAVSRHRWQTAFNAALAALGSAAIIVTIRANSPIAEGTGTDGAGQCAGVIAIVVALCLIAGGTGLTARLSTVRTSPRTARVSLASAAVLTLVALIAVGPALADRAWESFERRPESRAAADPVERLGNLSGIRHTLWEAAFDAFETDPLRGTGAGTFEYVWNRDPRRDAPVRDAHSLYVETLAEVGLPGLILIVLALGSLLVTALRAPFRQPDAAAAGAAAGCAIALLVFCVTAGVDWMWELTAVTSLGLICGGLAAVAGARAGARLRLPVRIAAGLLALLWLAVQLPVLVGATEVRASQRAIEAGRVADAVSDATTAVDAQPWAASGYLQRALVLERAGLLRRAAVDAGRATRKEPTNWHTWLILGRIEAERGREPAALRAARRARALNPRSPLFSPPQ